MIKTLTILIVAFAACQLSYCLAQDRGEFSVAGKVTMIAPGTISIVDEKQNTAKFKIQNKDEDSIVVDGRRLSATAVIKVTGELPTKLLKPGMMVRFDSAIDRAGRFESPLALMELIGADKTKPQVESGSIPTGKQFVRCKVVGRVEKVGETKLQLSVEKSELAKRGSVSVKLDSNATFVITEDSLNWVQPGDRVKRASGITLASGTNVIREIEIELSPDRQQTAVSLHDRLMQKHSKWSDEPSTPREVRSDHFLLITDVSDRNAKVLLDKLEIMYDLIFKYYRRAPRGQPIQCFVVRDLSQWRPGDIEAAGRSKIEDGAGVTLTATLGNSVRSIVYSCDKHAIVQHEAVHAYCHLTFGNVGPVWYAEGMAEMANYWKPNQIAVDINPVVIGYLTSTEPKKLLDIVQAGQQTGDSWQAYSWRWALCHLLATNPNYSDRFKALGLSMMSGKGGSFESAYGDIAKEISFEYDQFVRNFGNGYRVDLCAWDWKTRATRLKSKRKKAKSKIEAQKGWQASRLEVEKGKSYEYITTGTWKLSGEGKSLTANGTDSGNGRLLAAILDENYELSKPIELGESGSFQPVKNGILYLRCRDAWTELADNDGTVTVEFRLPKK